MAVSPSTLSTSVRPSGWFWAEDAIFAAPISCHAKLLYLFLKRCSDAEGESFPSHRRIGEAMGCGVTRVKSALDELLQAGLLTIQSRAAEGRSNLYTVHSVRPPGDEGVVATRLGVVATRLGGSRQATTEGLHTEGLPTEGLKTPPPYTPPQGGTPTNGYTQEAKELLDLLNSRASRHFQANATNLGFITGRLRDGTTFRRCKAVILRKVTEWQGDPMMDKFLRPATLFNKTKFNQYEGELPESFFSEAASG